MPRYILPTGKVDRTGLRRWFLARFGYRPAWHTISEAIEQGLPCEPHPLLPGKVLFDLAAVEAFLVARSRAT